MRNKLPIFPLLAIITLFASPGAQAGAPRDADLRCKTPLLAAAKKNKTGKIRKLLAKGARANEKTAEGFNALICAADSGATEAVSLLLEKGADPNACTEDQNLCPLWYAAMGDHPQAMQMLIKNGARIEEINGWNGNTPLAWSVRNGKTAAVKVLVEAGAALASATRKEYYGGKTAFELAREEGHREVVEIIEKAAGKQDNPPR